MAIADACLIKIAKMQWANTVSGKLRLVQSDSIDYLPVSGVQHLPLSESANICPVGKGRKEIASVHVCSSMGSDLCEQTRVSECV